MHGLRIGTAAALVVAVSRGVVLHIFGLPGFAVHLDVIQNHIAVGAIVGELYLDIPGCTASVGVILIAGG